MLWVCRDGSPCFTLRLSVLIAWRPRYNALCLSIGVHFYNCLLQNTSILAPLAVCPFWRGIADLLSLLLPSSRVVLGAAKLQSCPARSRARLFRPKLGPMIGHTHAVSTCLASWRRYTVATVILCILLVSKGLGLVSTCLGSWRRYTVTTTSCAYCRYSKA